eukprot:4439864-Prymnesium_polylepis.1
MRAMRWIDYLCLHGAPVDCSTAAIPTVSALGHKRVLGSTCVCTLERAICTLCNSVVLRSPTPSTLEAWSYPEA